MSRSLTIGIAAVATFLSPIAAATAQDGIVVQGPRTETTRPESGSIMGMSRVTGATNVYYGDLDLTTTIGRSELRNRVLWAAKRTCDRLEELNRDNIPLSNDEPCFRQAVHYAQAQVDRAIRTYGG